MSFQWFRSIEYEIFLQTTNFNNTIQNLIITLTQVVQVQGGQPLLFYDRKFGTLQQADIDDIPVFCSAEQWRLL